MCCSSRGSASGAKLPVSWAFLKAVDYNGAHHAIAKAAVLAEAKCPRGYRIGRTTKRPLAGIIDSAFETASKLLSV